MVPFLPTLMVQDFRVCPLLSAPRRQMPDLTAARNAVRQRHGWMPRMLMLALLPALVYAPHPAQAGTGLPLRGWLIHTGDRQYVRQVLEAARSYGINHLDLSHEFVDRIDEILQRPELAELVEWTAREGRRRGIRVFVWSRELNTRDRSRPLDPATPQGRRFWEHRKAAYRHALRRCPSIAGVVLSLASAPTDVWDPRIADPGWNRLSWPQRVRIVTGTVRSVVCDELGKELWVRDFNHGPAELRALVDGLRDCPGITVYSKAEPQDFQLFYPHSFSVGAYGRTPQVLELDLNGEYWGQSLVPVSLVGYLRYRMSYGVRMGIRGAVGRIDTYHRRALGTPSEINLYAFSRLLDNPSATEQAIYDGWLQRRYGLRPNTSAAQRLQAILRRTATFAKLTYYTLGFWTPKNQSSLPSSMDSLTGCIRGKSTALWRPSAKAAEERLINPDRAVVREILYEKNRAVALAEQNLWELRGLWGHLRASDYRELRQYLTGAVRVARVYQSVAKACWLARLMELRRGNAEDAAVAWAECNELIRWAERIEEGQVPLPNGPTAEARALRQFVSDVRRVLRGAGFRGHAAAYTAAQQSSLPPSTSRSPQADCGQPAHHEGAHGQQRRRLGHGCGRFG